MEGIEEAKRAIEAAAKGEIPIEYVKTEFDPPSFFTFKVGEFTILTFNDADDSDWIMEIKKDGVTIWEEEKSEGWKTLVNEDIEMRFCEIADDVRFEVSEK